MNDANDISLRGIVEDVFGLLRSYSRHRDYVRAALGRVVDDLEQRATVHDASKMLDDEFFGFARINAAARVNKFGSPEYAAGMKTERHTIDTHFKRNSHHPERPTLLARATQAHPDSGPLEREEAYHLIMKAHAMTFLDVIEMVCDWHGARKGYDSNMSWQDSVALNFKQKGAYLSEEQRWLAMEVAKFLEPFS